MSTVTISAALPGLSRQAGLSRQSRQSRQVGLSRQAGLSRQSPPAGSVQLTRRGRLVLTLLVVVGLLAGGVLLAGGLASAGTEPGAAATAERVTVRPGETLWSIAERAAPGVDPRDTVEDILALNQLDSVAVEAGSVLLLP